MLDNIKFGTDNQAHYIGILKHKLGADLVAQTVRKVLGLDATAPLPESIAPDATSSIIDELKKLPAPKTRKAAVAQSDAAGTRMSGREILDLVDLKKEIPAGLEKDLQTVIYRLRRLNMLQASIAKPLIDKPFGINGSSPIMVSQLIEQMGSPSEVAKALGVTLKTLEGWGDYLPESHESRAQLVTAGAVQARLPV